MDNLVNDLLRRIEAMEKEHYLYKQEMRQQLSKLDQRIHELNANFILLGLNDVEGKVDVLNKRLLEVSATTEKLKKEFK